MYFTNLIFQSYMHKIHTIYQCYIPQHFTFFIILIRWAGNVVRIGRGEVYTGFWWGKPSERDHLGDPGVDGRIILKQIFRKSDGGYGVD
jgi:hypothetical protein